jgi:SAM-dependent methyltransferase
MLNQGIRELETMGEKVDHRFVMAKPMSETGIKDDSCDAVVCSLSLHYSSSAEDRARTLREANRILKTGGYYIITLHEGYIVPEQAKKLAALIEKFGFTIDAHLSGKAKATDYKENPFSVWMFVAKKTGQPQMDEMTLDNFHFTFEAPKVSKYRDGNGEKKKRIDGDEDGKLVKHEQFAITGFEDGKSKGSPDELLRRLSLGLTEEGVRKLGWRIDTRETKEGTNVILKR